MSLFKKVLQVLDESTWEVKFPNPKLQHQWDKSFSEKGKSITVKVKAVNAKQAINKAAKQELGLSPSDAKLFVDMNGVKQISESINEELPKWAKEKGLFTDFFEKKYKVKPDPVESRSLKRENGAVYVIDGKHESDAKKMMKSLEADTGLKGVKEYDRSYKIGDAAIMIGFFTSIATDMEKSKNPIGWVRIVVWNRKLRDQMKKPIGESMSSNAANVAAGDNIDLQNPLHNPNLKRKQFNGCEVFEVDSEYYHKCTMGKQKYHKYEKYVGNSEVGEAIRSYGRANPKKSIIVQDSKTGAMQYLRRV